jgi:hypothetical protein
MNDTISRAIEPGPHTLQVRSGRNSSRIKTFDLAEGEIASFRCTRKSILPIFFLSFAVPSLALNSAPRIARRRTSRVARGRVLLTGAAA